MESLLPKYAKKMYPTLINTMRNLSISWDSNTHELIVDGRKIEKSNIIDLVTTTLRRSTKSPNIVGWKVFTDSLQKAGTSSKFDFKLTTEAIYERHGL